MNAVEIEEAISQLAEQAFDAVEFPFAFLAAFGNKETTLKRLRSGSTNNSDIEGGVLQRNNIHMAVCEEGEVTDTLINLKASPATSKAKAKFVLATDGVSLEAEDLTTGETIVCEYPEFPDHFGFFLPLAGISTVKQIRESSFDIKATGRLNRLYVELLKDNSEWGTVERRHDMNHFMARLIFCFFAEDTDIFHTEGLFTKTIEEMSARDSSDTHHVISEIFRAMNTRDLDKERASLPSWIERKKFPYVNGGLFSGNTDVPRFSKIARSYLIHIGNLDWTKINPDIFGSMIQAVTDEEERGALGLHYTSVPNILKVLNPLFLDDLRAKLEEAGDNPRLLLNLRKRMAKIRVFDPACGSGNFLVIAYKEMREIEAEINRRRKETGKKTDIPLTNFRGIELRDFPAEIARLALIIAEYQCDVHYRGQKEALAEFLPLNAMNWIICGNALRLDWLSVCRPTGTAVKILSNDLFEVPVDQAEIDFENEGGETYICGNPSYLGYRGQDKNQKQDLAAAVSDSIEGFRGLDFVTGWLVKAVKYLNNVEADFAFVSTNSICQGQQVALLWPWILKHGLRIRFATTSFKWANLAKNNAGVTVVIIGITSSSISDTKLYEVDEGDKDVVRLVSNISPYLVPGKNVFISSSRSPIFHNMTLDRGSAPTDGGAYLFNSSTKNQAIAEYPFLSSAILRAIGANEFSKGLVRWALKPDLLSYDVLESNEFVVSRVNEVRESRLASTKKATVSAANTPERYTEDRYIPAPLVFVPQLVAEGREYVTPGLLPSHTLVLAPHFQTDFSSMLPMALIASRLHFVWIATVCGRLKTDYRYSNTLGWNAFPVPTLTAKMKEDLTRCAEDILLAREAHFPATIADLYDPENMPDDLRLAHERNDEVLERIYIGRRFKNDTERLEKLFDLYTKMTAKSGASKNSRKAN